MLIIESYLSDSPGKGLGLFTKSALPRGTIYWVRSESFDKIHSSHSMKSLEEIQRKFIEKYGFLESTGNWYLCVDNARFSNHSENPNTTNHLNSNGELLYCSVNRDILPGEEIYCNYRDICQKCLNDLGFENNE